MKHPFFSDVDLSTIYTSKVPIPASLETRRETIKIDPRKVGFGGSEKKKVKELKRGILKKKNEWYMQ